MARKDEPSNPFKKSGRIDSAPKSKRSSSPRKRGPAAPPGRAAPVPAVPPGSNTTAEKDTAKNPAVRSTGPAKAGKSVGLRKRPEPVRKDRKKEVRSDSASAVPLAQQPIPAAKEIRAPKKTEPDNPFKKKKVAKQTRRPAGRYGKRNRPQAPSKRIRKLNRGKYMEFKYDVRKILDEEEVEDEHRSNVLGQTWAKGERQGVNEAKDFLTEKVSANIISQNCADRIIKLIDTLTTRR